MSKRTIFLLLGAAGAAGFAYWAWRRTKGVGAPSLSIPGSLAPPGLAPVATPAQVAAGAWVDATGWHIPAAVRTPEQQQSAIAAEIRANSARGF